MGMPEKEGRCTRHPSHRLSKGVCPHCLRERLNILSASSSSSANDISSATASPPAAERRGARGLSRLFKSQSFSLATHKGWEKRRPAMEAEGKKRKSIGKEGISRSKTIKEKSFSKLRSFFS
ncbi:hypothetical protein HPP92_010908 [Vanilla planifolia]|uniref:Uncharacterized protein n=1 Tax=Vanilla planifolia TaxID=51239 RepID=A0A835R1U7_VANPL|nr:hypothetical protein HPP92_011195 [Vanilla planifolia]KAG0482824.1 hypothetical protein HPP92_010908 [Vanilla planifolia]